MVSLSRRLFPVNIASYSAAAAASSANHNNRLTGYCTRGKEHQESYYHHSGGYDCPSYDNNSNAYAGKNSRSIHLIDANNIQHTTTT